MYIVLLLKICTELVETLVWMSNSPPLELICRVTPNMHVVEDALEEEAVKQQCISNSYFENNGIFDM
jgi:hypothetical protein